MNLSLEDRIKILVLYWGQQGCYSFSDDPTRIDCEIGIESIKVQLNDPDECCLQVYLKDLSEMSDDEYMHVGRIAGYEVDRHNSTPLLVIMKAKKLIEDVDHYIPNGMAAWIDIIDYLRKQGYALKYNGQCLFDLNIAVKSLHNE